MNFALTMAMFRHVAAASALPARMAFNSPCTLRHFIQPAPNPRAIAGRRGKSTSLGSYLEKCGATWGDAVDVNQVVAETDDVFSWTVDLPAERLKAVRNGELLESPAFTVRPGVRARFHFFPNGDDESEAGTCSLWLWSDDDGVGPFSLRIGKSAEHTGGSSKFCALEDALDGADSVKITMKTERAESPSSVSTALEKLEAGRQSLRLQGLTHAEWRVLGVQSLAKPGDLHISPPFRFHHVLLGDMYLEILFGESLATLFFRCMTPNVMLQVGMSVGEMFTKSFTCIGCSTHDADKKAGACLQVNLNAPNVVKPDGSLNVVCKLEQVVSVPANIRDMMPRLDERTLWPKRL